MTATLETTTLINLLPIASDFSVRPLSVTFDEKGWVASQDNWATLPMSDAACARFLEGLGAEPWEAILLMYGAPSGV